MNNKHGVRVIVTLKYLFILNPLNIYIKSIKSMNLRRNLWKYEYFSHSEMWGSQEGEIGAYFGKRYFSTCWTIMHLSIEKQVKIWLFLFKNQILPKIYEIWCPWTPTRRVQEPYIWHFPSSKRFYSWFIKRWNQKCVKMDELAHLLYDLLLGLLFLLFLNLRYLDNALNELQD